jgi:hypothetical protein
MRTLKIGFVTGLLLTALLAGIQVHVAAAGEGDPHVGTWAGTWEGGGTGKFELTFKLGSDGKLTGGVAVGTDMGDYTAKFTKVSFDGNQLTATYDYPLDAQGEISLSGTFEGKSASGTWGLGPKGQSTSQAMATGTWKIEKN